MGNDPSFHLSLRRFSLRCDGIDLVNEEQTRCEFLQIQNGSILPTDSVEKGENSLYLSFLKRLSQCLFGFSRHARNDGGGGDRDKRHAKFLSEEKLPSPLTIIPKKQKERKAKWDKRQLKRSRSSSFHTQADHRAKHLSGAERRSTGTAPDGATATRRARAASRSCPSDHLSRRA